MEFFRYVQTDRFGQTTDGIFCKFELSPHLIKFFVSCSSFEQSTFTGILVELIVHSIQAFNAATHLVNDFPNGKA